MKIVVGIKQVPDTTHVKFDANGNVQPDSVELILNPCCGYAVETAIRIKEAHEGSTVIAFTVGGPQAKDVLKRAIAMGCDEAYLLNDGAFQDSDAFGTARILTAAIQKIAPDFDMLLFGQYTDEDLAGITGPAVAESLNVPNITLASKAELKDAQTILVERQTEQGLERYEATLPAMVCMANCDYEPRIPSIKGVMKANRTEIPTLDAAALGLAPDQVGKAGSTVITLNTWRKPRKEGGIKIDGSDPQEAVTQLIGFLKEQKLM